MGSVDHIQFLFKHYDYSFKVTVDAFWPWQKQNSDFQFLTFPIGDVGDLRWRVGSEDPLQFFLKGIYLFKEGSSRPVAGGVRGCDAPHKSAERSTFSHKVGQKWGFCRRVRGGEVQKSQLFEGSAPPQNRSWLRAWGQVEHILTTYMANLKLKPPFSLSLPLYRLESILLFLHAAHH